MSTKKENILVVDDMLENRQLLREILEEAGYNVRPASSGALALRSANANPPGLVLLDIRMPGMDGYEVCRKLKEDEALRDIPVIFLSALSDTKGKIRAFAVGGVDYIIKPFSPEEVLARVKTHLHLKHLQEMQEKYSHFLEDKVREGTEALAESEDRYRRLMEDLPVGVFRTAPGKEGKILMCNPATAAMFGCNTVDEFMKIPLSNRFKETETMEHFWDLLEKQGSVQREEVELKKCPEGFLSASVTAHTILDKQGTCLYIDGIIEDITEIKTLEGQLQQVQKMDAVARLTGGIAHDFNNLLAGMLGFAQLAQLYLARGEKIDEYLNEIVTVGIRARDLVKQILAFSRQSQIQKQPININPLIKETLKLVRASFPTTIRVKHNIQGDEENIVNADPTHIHQVLMNICTNAAHAMKEKGGLIDIRSDEVRIKEKGVLDYKDIEPGVYLRLVISDTGHGIPPDIIDRVFDPFFTTKKSGEGTGLGLSVVHGIVKELGGGISVYSEPGKGTTFNILLPKCDALEEDAETAVPRAEGGKARILLVDDEEIITRTGKGLLEKYGYHVTVATECSRALDMFRERPGDFDIVFTDLTMPRMTGIELAEELSKIRPGIPIILCTGFSAGLTDEILKKYGISRMVLKPMIADEMLRAVEETLGNKSKSS